MSIVIKNKQDKTYVVLSAPHSASSFIGKMLQDAGVDMHVDMKEHYQDLGFVNLNSAILKAAGGNAYQIPSEKKILSVRGISRHIKSLIEKRKKKFWGWKDPATSLTFKHYLPHLKDDVYLICAFRKPDILVKSYEKKEGGRITREVVDRYNNAILDAIKEFCELK